VIELTDVSYAYPDAEHFVLEGINLTIPRGTITGILGASGSGKTTLAKIISGFIPGVDGGELSGQVSVGGTDLTGLSLAEAISRGGLVIQNPFNQISGARYTVREEIAFGLENIGTPRDEMREKVARVAELLQITQILDRSPYALSGGQQQLVAIASMIVLETPVLVMDEPTSQLDPLGTRMVFEVLAKLREADITVVIFEHKLELLHEHAQQLHVLFDSQIVASGSPSKILSDSRLIGWGVGATRYTSAARATVERGLWAPEQSVPVSFAEAALSFSVGKDG